MAKELSIKERFDILDEAIDFYWNLSDAWQKNYELSLRKAAALSTVKEWLGVYQDKMMEGAERTEKDIAEWINSVIRPEFVDMMAVEYEMTEEQKDFYEWGFGLAAGILLNDKEQIDGLRKMQAAYDDLIEAKLSNRTLADIIWDLSKK